MSTEWIDVGTEFVKGCADSQGALVLKRPCFFAILPMNDETFAEFDERRTPSWAMPIGYAMTCVLLLGALGFSQHMRLKQATFTETSFRLEPNVHPIFTGALKGCQRIEAAGSQTNARCGYLLVPASGYGRCQPSDLMVADEQVSALPSHIVVVDFHDGSCSWRRPDEARS